MSLPIFVLACLVNVNSCISMAQICMDQHGGLRTPVFVDRHIWHHSRYCCQATLFGLHLPCQARGVLVSLTVVRGDLRASV